MNGACVQQKKNKKKNFVYSKACLIENLSDMTRGLKSLTTFTVFSIIGTYFVPIIPIL